MFSKFVQIIFLNDYWKYVSIGHELEGFMINIASLNQLKYKQLK
jgi:hypothetical protein